jgi:hypothetical protein
MSLRIQVFRDVSHLQLDRWFSTAQDCSAMNFRVLGPDDEGTTLI